MESNTIAGLPPGPSMSTMAGTLPFGLIAELGRMLLALAGVHRLQFIWEPGFFEEERDLRGIGRWVKVELNHGDGLRVVADITSF